MVSVIIPIYNVEKYLRQCIDSVLSQTYGDLEIILVDDGSPDKCGEICDEYALKDSRISVIHKENGGLSDARNAGLKAAQGEYIYFLDSDDYIRKDAMQLLVNTAEKEKADIIFFSARSFADNKMPVPDSLKLCHHYTADTGVNVLVRRFENQEWFSAVQLHFFRKDFIDRNMLRFAKGLLYEDQLFSGTAFMRAGKAAALNKQLYYYRAVRNGSIMSSKPKIRNFNCFITVAKAFIAEKGKAEKGSLYEKGCDYLIRYCFNRCVMTYCDMGRSDQKKAKRCLRYIRHETERIKSVNCIKLKMALKFPHLWFLYYKGIRKYAKYLIQLAKH